MSAPVGEFVISQLWRFHAPPVTTLPEFRVEHADPVIRISDQLVVLLSNRDWRHPQVSFDGKVIKIDAVNGRFIYQLRGRDPHNPDCWIASWPD